jgi:predicted dehydrogenase/threonine dehydrogenase-like Zn-dependent dehydrogenase
MKQILQDIKKGDTTIVEIPCPGFKRGFNLIKTKYSLISAGTERMLIDFGKAGYIAKARQQPEKVKMVLDKIRTDGLVPTIEAVRSKLDHPLPLGYSNVGNVVNLDGTISSKRMVCNGHHAEYVCVPNNLCAEIPDAVSDEEASFTVLGAIALQGIRLAQPALGETFVVTGLGLIGQLTVQLLLANGCRVLGIDMDEKKCRLAESFGAETVDISKGEDPIAKAAFCSREKGVDGVLITASTKSNDPVHQAALMCRKRGRIVLVGVTGLELNRSDFYEKELSFQVSCSYGPGRYDPEYEEKGHDYPIGFVRWTEQRNFEAILNMLGSGKLNVKPLISHRFSFDEALTAYQIIAENREPYLGILLDYGVNGPLNNNNESEHASRQVILKTIQNTVRHKTSIVAAVIGAGNFTGQVILPVLKKSGIRLKTIASSGGISSTHQGSKNGFEISTTDTQQIFSDPEINTVFITTRHDSHFDFVMKGINSGKHVFVEKPLCLSSTELEEIKKTYLSRVQDDPRLILFIGFNRRFAPQIMKMKTLLGSGNSPKSMIMTVNAGQIPAEHWIHDPKVGGGRIIGEACHFIDLLRFLADCEIRKSRVISMASGLSDTVSLQIEFSDGSIGTIHYFANGCKAFPKERLEVFCENKVLQLDNFRMLKGFGWKNFRKMKLFKQDKGHAGGIAAFLQAIENGTDNPIPFDEIVEVTAETCKLAESISCG